MKDVNLKDLADRSALLAGLGVNNSNKSMTNEENNNPNGNIIEIPIDDIRDYGGDNRNHKFKLIDEKVKEIAESIDAIGKILEPCIVRKDPDNLAEYEMLAGHHRRQAAKIKQLKTVPCIVIECDNDVEANAITAITNVQREELAIMEKAYMYKYQYEYLKHQGKKGYDKLSLSELAEKSNENERTIYRLIKLTDLIEELQEKIEDKTLSKGVGEIFSEFEVDNQKIIHDYIVNEHLKISISQAELLKEYIENGNIFTYDNLANLLRECKMPEKIKHIKIIMPEYTESYFPEKCDTPDAKADLLLRLLIAYKKNPGMLPADEDSEEEEVL